MGVFRQWMGGIVLDVRYVLRVLAGSPVFTTVAVLSLAIGIGANTVMFSVARFALLDPLPVDRPDELRVVQWSGPAALEVSQYNSGGSTDPVTKRAIRTNYSHPVARALEATSGPAQLFAFNFLSQVTVGMTNAPAVAAGGLLVSGRYFAVLRPRLEMGRGLTAADDTEAAPNVAVISYGFWRRAFGGAPDVLGSIVPLNGTPFTIVGVTAPGFRGLSSGSRFAPLTDVTIPIAKQPVVWSPEGGSWLAVENRLWLRVMARVPAGDSAPTDAMVAQALTPMLRQAMRTAPFMTPEALDQSEIRLAPGARGVDAIARNAGRPLTILAVVVGVVLLIACVNLASLTLARGVSRQRELSVRRALGASRPRLVRQLLVESLSISIAGGLVGGLLALWMFPVVAGMVTAGFNAPAVELPVDWRTFALTAGVSGLAGLLFGMVPAIGLSRPETTAHLRHRVVGAAAPKLTIGRVLLAMQIAISLPLISAAALLLATIGNLSRVDLGFNARDLVTFRLDPNQGRPGAGPGAASPVVGDLDRFARTLVERIETIPGVASATLLENALVSGWVSNNNITIDGQRASIHMNGVGPRYFETLQIPLRSGRAPTLQDTRETPRVAVINETAARQLFGDPSPIGRRFTLGRHEVEVIGVAADTKYSDLRGEVVPTMFDPFLQRARAGAMHVVVRTHGAVPGLDAALRRTVAAVNADVPITDMRTQREQVDLAMGSERLLARLLSVFGGFALALACIGLYGATAYAVARRTNEIGVRVALGAQRAHVVWLVLRQVIVLVGAGLAIGIPAAWATGPLVGSQLYGVGPREPATLAAAAGLMLGVALLAGFVPARRAATMEVLAALRQE
jgi:predicted permease